MIYDNDNREKNNWRSEKYFREVHENEQRKTGMNRSIKSERYIETEQEMRIKIATVHYLNQIPRGHD